MRRLAWLACVALVLGPAVRGVAAGGVTFRDPALEEAVRDALLRPRGELWEADLLALTQLTARGRTIVHLDGIEHLAHLRVLDLSINVVYDLQPLAGLTELELLDLSENQVRDLSPLRSLGKLQRLILSTNQVRDIAPLLDLPGLVSVDLVGNPLDRAGASPVLWALVRRGVEVASDIPMPEDPPQEPSAGWQVLGPVLGRRALRVGSVVTPAADPQRVYAAAGGSGVWASRDGGASWEPSGLFSGLVLHVATDAEDPEVVYASIAFGAGLMRSRDGARTWKRLEVPQAAHLLAADGNVPGRVYAERRDAVDWAWFGEHPTEVGVAVFVSQDYGETWERSAVQWTQPMPGFGYWPYLFAWSHPADPRRVWAGAYVDPDGIRTLTAAFLSEDGGRSFAQRVLQRDVADLAADPSDAHGLFGLDAGGLWRSPDDGQTWTLAASLPRQNLGRLAVHLRFPQSVWAWGSQAVDLWRWQDAGRTWARGSLPAYALLPGDYSGWDWAMTDPRRGYAAAGVSGVARTTDAGTSWDVVPLSAGTMGVTSLAVDRDGAVFAAVDPGELLLGRYTPNNALLQVEYAAQSVMARYTPLEQWVTVRYGAISPAYPSALWADVRHPGLLFGYGRRSGGWLRSVDRGQSWALVQLSGQSGDATPHERVASSVEGVDVCYARDPADSALYRSADRGATWDKVAAGVSRFAVHPRRPGLLFAAEADGPIRASTDTGRTWSVVGTCPAGDRVLRLAVHPLWPDSLCAACTSGLYRLAALGGEVHELLSTGSPWSTAEIAFDPSDAGDLCVLADGGLWDTDDEGRTWRLRNEEPGAPAQIDAVVIDPSDGRLLYVGSPTGVYRVRRSAAATAIGQVSAAPLPEQPRLFPPYPNPFNSTVVVRYTVPEPAQVEMSVYDILGQRVATLVRDMRPPGQHTATWSGRDGAGRALASGAYLCQLRVGTQTHTRKVVLLR